MPITIIDGVIQIQNGLPIKIGDQFGLLPGLQHLYFQNVGKKYPFAWAADIPFVHFIDNQETGKLELYSTIALNDSQWKPDVLNFSQLFQNHTLKYQHLAVNRPQLQWSWAYKLNSDGSIYNPFGSYSQNLNFIDAKILKDIAIKMFGVLGLPGLSASQSANYANNLSITSSRRLVKTSQSLEWSQQVLTSPNPEKFYLNALDYLIYLNSVPGVGTIDFMYYPIRTFFTQEKQSTYNKTDIAGIPFTMQYSVNVSLADLVNFIQSRGENTINLGDIPDARKHTITGSTTIAPPPSTEPPPPPSTLPTTDATTEPPPPPALPTLGQPGAMPPTTNDASTNGGENLTDYSQPGQDLPTTSSSAEPPPPPTATDGTIPTTDLNTWIDSRLPDDLTLLPKTNETDAGEVIPDAQGGILPTQALQPLPLPEGYTVDKDGRLTKTPLDTAPLFPDRGVFYPIGNYQWGKHFDVPLRPLKIDPSKYCAIGRPCYGSHYETEPPLWWFRIHTGSTR